MAAAQPFTYVPAQRAAYERDAALGLSHVLFAKSPGRRGGLGPAHRALAADRRPRRPRPQARRRHARGDRHARVGRARPTRARPTTCARPSGLTQILAETGQNLLGLHIDVKASERLTRGILRGRRVRQREALRRRVDERFDPAKAIEATARYLDFAKGKLGRDDLAVVSYHMGVGNLQQALMAYGKGVVPYAQLYFDSSPLRHAAAWRKLASLGDDSSTYLWRVLAAREIMRLYRTDPKALQREAVLQSHKASAEEVLHPAERTPVFADPFAIGRARASGELRAIDSDGPRALRAEHGPAAWASSRGRDQAVAAPVPRAAPAGARGAPGARRGDAARSRAASR